MIETIHTDVLVVGLGPAGASALATVAEHGWAVIGIDKRQRIGEPVQCAEYIPAPLASQLHSGDVQYQAVDCLETRLNGSISEITFPGNMIDRGRFDRHLVERGMQQGGQIYTQAYLQRLDNAQRLATLNLRNNSNSRQIRIKYRILIAADGPRSRVAKQMNLPSLPCLRTRQYELRLRQTCSKTKAWISAAYPGGYAWLFPKGEWANLGLGFYTRQAGEFQSRLDDLHRQLVKEGLVEQGIISRTGGLIPVGGIRNELCLQHILFAGDAAGLTHPISGAGIASAVYSGASAGHIAAEYLAGKASLEAYAEDIREIYGPSMAHAVQKRRLLERNWRRGLEFNEALLRQTWIAYPEYRLKD